MFTFYLILYLIFIYEISSTNYMIDDLKIGRKFDGIGAISGGGVRIYDIL